MNCRLPCPMTFGKKPCKQLILRPAALGLVLYNSKYYIGFTVVKPGLPRSTRVDQGGCNRCSQTPCDLTHMFWSCPKLFNFWQLFFDTISRVLELKICPSPHIAIFGRPPEGINATVTQVNVISFTSLIARRRILSLWKSPSPPSFKAWLCDTLSFLKLEKIKFTLRGSSDKFYSHWKPLINYVKQLSPGEMSL